LTSVGSGGTGWQDDERLRTWRLFLEARTRIVRRMDDDLQANHQLSIEWYDVLVQLFEAGGRRTMGNLASALLISPSNCSRLVDRMAADGLVRREADTADGRVKHAVLTDEGFAVLKAASPTHLASIERYFTSFLGGDPGSVLDLFSQILGALEFGPGATESSSSGTAIEPAEGPNDPGRGGGT